MARPVITGYRTVWYSSVTQQAIGRDELTQVINQKDFVQTADCFASLGGGDTGVEKRQVQFHAIALQAVAEGVNVVQIGQVQVPDLNARRAARLAHPFRRFRNLAAASHDDVTTAPRQIHGNGLSYATAGAGNQAYLAVAAQAVVVGFGQILAAEQIFDPGQCCRNRVVKPTFFCHVEKLRRASLPFERKQPCLLNAHTNSAPKITATRQPHPPKNHLDKAAIRRILSP